MILVVNFTFLAYLLSAFVASVIVIVATHTSYNITLDRIPKALRFAFYPAIFFSTIEVIR